MILLFPEQWKAASLYNEASQKQKFQFDILLHVSLFIYLVTFFREKTLTWTALSHAVALAAPCKRFFTLHPTTPKTSGTAFLVRADIA